MHLINLELKNFRNYQAVDISFSKGINFLIGDNAQGKTNIVEAIYYLATGRPFRMGRDITVLNERADFFIVKGIVELNKRKLEVEIKYNKEKNHKLITINQIRQNKFGDIFGNFNAVLFSPEDLSLIKGGPNERRKFLDIDISQVSPLYYSLLSEYSKILLQRNNLLKQIKEGKCDNQLLEVFNIQLIDVATKIINKRLFTLRKLAPLARLIHRKITNGLENLEISYISDEEEINLNFSQEKIIDLLNFQLKNKQILEKKRGTTLIGPHRDDIKIKLNKSDIRLYGSQGQQRTATLSLKLAELEFFKAERGEYPVLLLDDVMSELDNNRRSFLLKAIKENNIQTFITSTELDYSLSKILDEIMIYKVIKGQINI